MGTVAKRPSAKGSARTVAGAKSPARTAGAKSSARSGAGAGAGAKGSARNGAGAGTSVDGMDLAQRRRMARRLVAGAGRGFAERAGFQVSNNPANLFQLLCLSLLTAGRGDEDRAVRAARALRERGWDSPARLAASPYEQRLAAIRDSGRPDARKLAGTLGELARAVVDEYQGDLRRIRARARHDPGRERQLLRALPGVSDAVVDLFFREAQAGWREIAPFADRRALGAARRLGLGRTVADLYQIAGGGESEKLAWLVSALVRVDLDRDYDRVRELARA